MWLVYLENLDLQGLPALQEIMASLGRVAREAFRDSKGHKGIWG